LSKNTSLLISREVFKFDWGVSTKRVDRKRR
jgi:hypothetical protein